MLRRSPLLLLLFVAVLLGSSPAWMLADARNDETHQSDLPVGESETDKEESNVEPEELEPVLLGLTVSGSRTLTPIYSGVTEALTFSDVRLRSTCQCRAPPLGDSC